MGVVTGLRTEKSAFEKAVVANSAVATKALNQALLNCEHLINREKLDRVSGQVGGLALRFPGYNLRGGP